MPKTLFTTCLALAILAIGVAAQADEITEDALVVGSGAVRWNDRNVVEFPNALITASLPAHKW